MASCGLTVASRTPNLVKISQKAAELWRFSFFQDGGRTPSWILIQVKNGVTACCGQSMSKTVPNFVTVCQLAAELLRFVKKIQNGGIRHFEFVFGNSGIPAKFTYGPEVAQKIWCQSKFYCSRYRNFKILKIWLKTPIQDPKIYVFWGFNP